MRTSIGSVHFQSPSTITLEALRTRYDRSAATWQRTLSRLGFERAYRCLFDRDCWDPELPIDRRLDILDVGVGTGAASAALVRALRRRGHVDIRVSGIDISPRMLSAAVQTFSACGVEFQGFEGTVERLEFPAGSFDLVIGAHVVEHLARPLRAIAEVDRVLRPGGTAILLMTRCAPITLTIQKRWTIQCARSRMLESVWRDFGMVDIQCIRYPHSLAANLLSFCCFAGKPDTSGCRRDESEVADTGGAAC